MTDLNLLAEEVAVSGRTLRRAASRGLIHCRHLSPRRILVPAGERSYVRRHWPLLRALLEALRTQSNVRLAVLFGSLARGDAGAESDLDLIARLHDESYRARADLVDRLTEASGRRVQLITFAQAEETPLLLADVLRDGRVLVDRDRDWPKLKSREDVIARQASAEDERLEREAWAAVELVGGSG